MNTVRSSVEYHFENKIVLVTGAGKGIGAGIARRFGESGAYVVVHCNTHIEEAQAVAQDIEEAGSQALVIQSDVTQPENVYRMFDQIKETFGTVDVLVNNAGIYPTQNLLDMSVEEWDRTLDINLKSVFLCTQAAARQMVASQKGGSIINISSIEGVNPAPGHCHYSSSKAGVDMFTMNAALELGPYRIRVNSVAPGLINSPQLADNWEEGVNRWMSRVPLGRLGEATDIAAACLFFADDASAWITGTRLVVDGGILTTQIF